MKKGLILSLKIIVLVIFVVWVFIVFIDYFRTRQDEKPMFCISEKTYKYADGKTYECVGIGYKMYKYERDSINATEFGPIFIEQKTNGDTSLN